MTSQILKKIAEKFPRWICIKNEGLEREEIVIENNKIKIFKSEEEMNSFVNDQIVDDETFHFYKFHGTRG